MTDRDGWYSLDDDYPGKPDAFLGGLQTQMQQLRTLLPDYLKDYNLEYLGTANKGRFFLTNGIDGVDLGDSYEDALAELIRLGEEEK